jgi:hypothetical protein
MVAGSKVWQANEKLKFGQFLFAVTAFSLELLDIFPPVHSALGNESME